MGCVPTSVIGTGPEPAKPAGLTGLQGWPVRSAKKFHHAGFFSKPGTKLAGQYWGLTELKFKKKTQTKT